jgi:hypothetical protein
VNRLEARVIRRMKAGRWTKRPKRSRWLLAGLQNPPVLPAPHGVEGAALPVPCLIRGSLHTSQAVSHWITSIGGAQLTWRGKTHTRAPHRPLAAGGREVHRLRECDPARVSPPACQGARPLGGKDGKPAAFPNLGPQLSRPPLRVSGSLRTAESSPGCPNEVWRRNHQPIIAVLSVIPTS